MSHISVAVRVRPLLERERSVNPHESVEVSNKGIIVRQKYEDPKSFAFDFVYLNKATSSVFGSQERIYQDMGVPILDNALNGYNGCLFVYGQTGSGKSHTIMGLAEDPGIIPRLVEDLFVRIRPTDGASPTKVWISYLEINKEKLYDLLTPISGNIQEEESLSLFEHHSLGVIVPDATMARVTCAEEVKLKLQLGATKRTSLENVSRAFQGHSIFTLHIETNTVGSKVHFVDLAGSERIGGQTTSLSPVSGKTKINQSLTSLGIVIKGLADRMEFVPFRASKLTFLLKDSLGGNSRSFLIATVSPAETDVEQTVSSLRFANSVKQVVTRPKINFGNNGIVDTLRNDIVGLKTLLETTGTATTLAPDLTHKINEARELLTQIEAKEEIPYHEPTTDRKPLPDHNSTVSYSIHLIERSVTETGFAQKIIPLRPASVINSVFTVKGDSDGSSASLVVTANGGKRVFVNKANQVVSVGSTTLLHHKDTIQVQDTVSSSVWFYEIFFETNIKNPHILSWVRRLDQLALLSSSYRAIHQSVVANIVAKDVVADFTLFAETLAAHVDAVNEMEASKGKYLMVAVEDRIPILLVGDRITGSVQSGLSFINSSGGDPMKCLKSLSVQLDKIASLNAQAGAYLQRDRTTLLAN